MEIRMKDLCKYNTSPIKHDRDYINDVASDRRRMNSDASS